MKRAVVIGSNNKLMKRFVDDIDVDNVETYIIIKKESKKELVQFKNKITIIRYSGNVEHLKLLFKSIEPEIIYNLLEFNDNESEAFFDEDLIYLTEVLEAISVAPKGKFINIVKEDNCKDETKINLVKQLIKNYTIRYNFEVEQKEYLG